MQDLGISGESGQKTALDAYKAKFNGMLSKLALFGVSPAANQLLRGGFENVPEAMLPELAQQMFNHGLSPSYDAARGMFDVAKTTLSLSTPMQGVEDEIAGMSRLPEEQATPQTDQIRHQKNREQILIEGASSVARELLGQLNSEEMRLAKESFKALSENLGHGASRGQDFIQMLSKMINLMDNAVVRFSGFDMMPNAPSHNMETDVPYLIAR
jgi:hypothetical protein